MRRRYKATIEGDQITVAAQNIGNPGDGVNIIVPLGTDYHELKRAIKALDALITADFRAEQERKKEIEQRSIQQAGKPVTKNTEAES